ncbi:MAG: tRNA (adenosine(37)-N6)-threonylcarbamoyltransferase complex ATPase subunit type 1 TsaE [Candidatus Magasanikbacteria bacterium]|jgi:tRNA threonylcarbamoyladenosine biosynthesis protein TsaE|nr:tRNA (adenosine(37)-N6)-threonylcarbamoyltransferase complex ATPase subunit type 1 TsaE [Candidatus Magasanikbacteria bacterium]MBT4071887.1 tRNA (adenosine(37)-N6)-threonylcarbamoyltransferase complex ATPase subunit type 1 TsaE [Candidatus Magasanikbacteria bacterium]
MTNYTPKTKQEQITLGEKLATKWNGGDIVLLKGDLGAGKTTLAKGIALGLGIKKEITSPTFTLMNVYELDSPVHGIKQFVHVDTYRMDSEEELIDIGLEDYMGDSETLCLIEWPEKLDVLIKDKKVITLELSHGENGRVIKETA